MNKRFGKKVLMHAFNKANLMFFGMDKIIDFVRKHFCIGCGKKLTIKKIYIFIGGVEFSACDKCDDCSTLSLLDNLNFFNKVYRYMIKSSS